MPGTTIWTAMRHRLILGIMAGLLITCLGAGVLIGGHFAGPFATVRGNDGIEVACEYDKCAWLFGGCKHAGGQRSNCNLHTFGCGTIPCGTTFATLATFEDPRSSELWMAFGPPAVLHLTKHLQDDAYRHRVEALRTLTAMALEWDVEKLGRAARRAIMEVAAGYTTRPLDHMERDERVATLLGGIDLAAAIATPFLKASVRALENPDTVQTLLADDGLDYRAVVRHARNAR